MSCRSLFEQKLLRLHVTPSLDSVEVHSACQFARVELDVVVAGVDVSVDELCDLLAEGVEDGERYMRSMRQSILNRCRRVEGIRIVLHQPEFAHHMPPIVIDRTEIAQIGAQQSVRRLIVIITKSVRNFVLLENYQGSQV